MHRILQSAVATLVVLSCLISTISCKERVPALSTPSPTPTPLLTPTPTPTQSIDLSCWRLELPTGTANGPDRIPTPQLVAGYSSQYFMPSATGIEFWCPVTGVTTSGSKYARTELREAHVDGSVYNWTYTNFDSSLSATLSVTQVPSNGKIAVAQIHDSGAGGISHQSMLELLFDSRARQIYAQYRNLPTDSSNQPNVILSTDVSVGDTFSYNIRLSHDGALSIAVNGVVKFTKQMDSAWAQQGLYFKAGDYLRDNAGPDTEGGRVVFTDLVVVHIVSDVLDGTDKGL